MQAFMNGAGKQGVLLVSLGTIAELGEFCMCRIEFACIQCKAYLHNPEYVLPAASSKVRVTIAIDLSMMKTLTR